MIMGGKRWKGEGCDKEEVDEHRRQQSTVKTVQTPYGNSGNSGVGWSWLGLGLSLCAMPLLLVRPWRSRADQSNSETLVMSTSSR